MSASSILPFPPGRAPGEIIKVVISLIKALLTRPKQTEAPEDVTARAEQMRAFCDYVNKQAKQTEEAVVAELQHYGNLLVELGQSEKYFFLSQHKINFKNFHRQIDLLIAQIPGLISAEVSRRMTDSDPEFRKIHWMLPGVEKERAIHCFTVSVIQSAVNRSADLAEEIIDGIQSDFLELMEQEQVQAQSQLEFIQQQLSEAKAAVGDIVLQTELQYKAQHIYDCCVLVNTLLE